jgi:hypothetical protein
VQIAPISANAFWTPAGSGGAAADAANPAAMLPTATTIVDVRMTVPSWDVDGRRYAPLPAGSTRIGCRIRPVAAMMER